MALTDAVVKAVSRDSRSATAGREIRAAFKSAKIADGVGNTYSQNFADHLKISGLIKGASGHDVAKFYGDGSVGNNVEPQVVKFFGQFDLQTKKFVRLITKFLGD